MEHPRGTGKFYTVLYCDHTPEHAGTRAACACKPGRWEAYRITLLDFLATTFPCAAFSALDSRMIQP
jgi:hypothetical protein